MTSVFVVKLGSLILPINISIQKVNRSTLITYSIVIIEFLIQGKLGKIWYFEKTILLININMDVILEISFLAINNAKI